MKQIHTKLIERYDSLTDNFHFMGVSFAEAKIGVQNIVMPDGGVYQVQIHIVSNEKDFLRIPENEDYGK